MGVTREGPGGYTHGTLTHHLMTCFTPADTYSWPHLPKELFRVGISFMNKHKLSCVEIHAVTLEKKICTTEPDACA